MKSRGANIFCSVCHAEPWPDDPAIRETFDLQRVDDGWFCELHRAPRKRTPRPATRAPLDVVAIFERTLAGELGRLAEAVDDDASKSVEACRAELERGLGGIRKAIAAHEPPAAAARSKRKPSPTVNREGQGDLVAFASNGAPAEEGSDQ